MINEKMFANIIKQSPALVIITDTEGVILYVNEAVERTSGYLASEILGKTPRVFKSGYHTPSFYENLWHTIQSGNPWRNTIINKRKDGSLYYQVSYIFPVFGDKKIEYYADVAYPIAGPQEQIYQEHDVLLQISQSLRSAQDVRSLAEIYTRSLISMFGFSAIAIGLLPSGMELTENAVEPFDVDILHAEGIWKGLSGEKVSVHGPQKGFLYIEDIAQHRDTLPAALFHFPGILTVFRVPLIADDKIIGFMGIGDKKPISSALRNTLQLSSDILARALYRQHLQDSLKQKLQNLKEMQDSFIQTEKMASLGVLAAGIAHELNNPLTSILLYAELALERSLDDDIRQDIEQIFLLAKRAASIIRGMLYFSHNEPPEYEIVSLPEIIDETLNLLHYEFQIRHVKPQIDIERPIASLFISRIHLQQVLVNLLVNALHAVEDKEDFQSRHVGIRAWQIEENGRKKVRICISDNGVGIDAKDLPHIFDPFFSTKDSRKGTGLGLSICHGIAQRYGGSIWAESTLGQGTRLYFEIPVVEEQQMYKKMRKKLQTSPLRPSLESARLLVIDDEKNILEVFKRALQRVGYEVDTVLDGHSALEKILRKHYDLILCDLNLPGMRGDTLYNILRDKKPEAAQRILFVTGASRSSDISDFLEHTQNAFIIKPFEMDDLLKKIAQTLLLLEDEED